MSTTTAEWRQRRLPPFRDEQGESMSQGSVPPATATELPAQHEFENAEAYISGDQRRALAAGRSLPDRVHGSALFADISGFTALTEALAKDLGPQRGAEELTANLNRIFHAVIATLEPYGGDVIYFSGDAITCWLDGDDGARATACALAMQDVIQRVGRVATPSGQIVPLAMKIAVAVGPARRFVVGDPEIQLIEVLAGSLVDDLADAESHAEKQEAVLDQSALAALGARVELSERRVDPETGRTFGVVRRLTIEVDKVAPTQSAPLPIEQVRPWLLPAVYERLSAGRGEFLAELRPAIPVFIRFGGIDYDGDDEAIGKLDDFVRRSQRILDDYGGNALQLTLGDKGAYLYAVFGSPRAHEDDAARAASAALELRELDGVTAARDVQIGITHGRLRSGTYGHAMRRTFCCLGDAVNLSARLMSAAEPGQVLVSEPVRRGAGDAFTWHPLPELKVKGKADAVPVFALTGAKGHVSRRHVRYELEMFGREAELGALSSKLDDARAGEGRVVGVSAEAGLGKSRLVAELLRSARRGGVTVALGECQSFRANTPYFVWREIWRTLLDIEESRDDREQIGALESRLGAIDPSFVARAPLLDTVLGVSIPDSELTASFDAKLRKASLEDLLSECLRARAGEEPLLLVLEDCHWIDPLSRDLLEVLARVAATLPVLFLLAYRPPSDAAGRLGIERMAHFEEIPLAQLGPPEAELLIRAKLHQLFGVGAEASQALVELVTARSEGNPFYVEELLNYIHGQGVDPRDERGLGRLQLPESLHSLILSRVDTLAEAPRRTLKVASIVGRVFRAASLPGVYPELGTIDEVRACLDALRALDLVSLDQEAEQVYLFKHVVTQEVTYESMPFAIRSELHERVGGYIEESQAAALDRQLDLLAHHYWLSDNLPKKREYLSRAGEAAQAAYANAAAIDYFERLVPLEEDGERVNVLLKLGKVLEVVGEWGRAEEIGREALALAERLHDPLARAWCETALAEVARKQGRYDDATHLLELAADRFEDLEEDEGVGQVLHLAGTIATQRGDYERAREHYEASLEIRERLGDRASMAGLLSNLGVIATEQTGDFAASREYSERALAIRMELGDRWAIGVSQNNLGMIALFEKEYEEARTRFEESMRLKTEIGAGWMLALGHNNLGNATRGLGDYDAARAHYAASLRASRAYDDPWALAFLLEDLGVLAAHVGEHELALELVAAALGLREVIGSPRSPALEEELEGHLEPAYGALDAERQEVARNRGRGLDTGKAIERAVAFCEGAPVESRVTVG